MLSPYYMCVYLGNLGLAAI